MRLVKVDYHDGLGGALYFILHSQTSQREHVSKDTFYQIVNVAKFKVIDDNFDGYTTTSEYFLTF